MALAWDINSINADDLPHFFSSMAEREFGKELRQEIGCVWREYDRLVSIRRHEHIEPRDFSLLNYNEAEIVLDRWKSVLARAEKIQEHVAENQRPSIFELVVHPIQASYIFVALQISLGRNKLYARQRRNSANKLAQEVLDLFDQDFSLSEDFHALLNGKWNHIMQQPHYGFGDTWHAPSRDMISGLCYVQRRQNSNAITGQMGIAVEGHEGIRPGRCNEESDRTHPSRRDLVPGVTLGAMTRYGPESRWFDVYTRGAPTINWSASVPYNWIKLSASQGKLIPGEDDARVRISIDWDRVSAGFDEEILIDVRSAEGDFEQIHLSVIGRRVPVEFQTGIVESDGYISMPASSSVIESPYRVLPYTGRESLGSVSVNLNVGQVLSYLTYDIFVFTQSSKVDLLLYFGMTLDLDPTKPMTYDILVDDNTMQSHQLVPEPAKVGELPAGWFSAVQDCVWVKTHTITEAYFKPGKHTIQIQLSSSNMMLEKLVLDLGGMKESYLGPPPSFSLR
jgi:hypothetical protein